MRVPIRDSELYCPPASAAGPGQKRARSGAGITSAVIIKTIREVPGRSGHQPRNQKKLPSVWGVSPAAKTLVKVWCGRAGFPGQEAEDGGREWRGPVSRDPDGCRNHQCLPVPPNTVPASDTAGHTACCFKCQPAPRQGGVHL